VQGGELAHELARDRQPRAFVFEPGEPCLALDTTAGFGGIRPVEAQEERFDRALERAIAAFDVDDPGLTPAAPWRRRA